MFIGHFAVGFCGERFAPRTSLATLLAAALFLDLLWPWCGVRFPMHYAVTAVTI